MMRAFILLICIATLFAACGAPQTPTANDRQDRILQAAESWPQEPDFTVSFVALHPLGKEQVSDQARAQFDPNDDYWGLPRTGEYEFVAAYCAGCHSMEIVMQQRATRERWSYMLTWMTEKQGMVALERDDRDLFLDYLVEHFGP
ncbi:MAG: hypothetical protein AAF437_02595 [Pseudomonadota bacterium]